MERNTKAMLLTPVVMALIFSASYRSIAQDSASQPATRLKEPRQAVARNAAQPALDPDVELLRKDVRSQKKQIIAANMTLTDAEAEKFWPVYDRYTADLAKIYDTKMALIEEYLEKYQTMTGAEAENYIHRRAAV